jgi:hypothetical protein
MKPGLAELPNAVIVPHIASASMWTRSGMVSAKGAGGRAGGKRLGFEVGGGGAKKGTCNGINLPAGREGGGGQSWVPQLGVTRGVV